MPATVYELSLDGRTWSNASGEWTDTDGNRPDGWLSSIFDQAVATLETPAVETLRRRTLLIEWQQPPTVADGIIAATLAPFEKIFKSKVHRAAVVWRLT